MSDQVAALIKALESSSANQERMAAAIESSLRPNELAMAGLSEARQKEILSLPPPQKYRKIRGRSSLTQATFDFVVLQSKKFPKGRVVRLENYRHPKGIETHQSMKGLVPDGLQIRTGAMTGQEVGPDGDSRGVVSHRSGYSLQYLQWRWENFYQTDLRALCGDKTVRADDCVDAKDIDKVPWKESEHFVIEGQDSEDESAEA